MSNKGVLILLVVLVAIFGLILTCPNKEDHQSAIATQVTDIIKNDSVASSTGIGALGTTVVIKLIEAAVSNVVTVNNDFLFSIGSVKYNNERAVVSIGILHHVFCLFDKSDLEKFESPADGGSNIDNDENEGGE
jgi:preprotein translocase subunit YajC